MKVLAPAACHSICAIHCKIVCVWLVCVQFETCRLRNNKLSERNIFTTDFLTQNHLTIVFGKRFHSFAHRNGAHGCRHHRFPFSLSLWSSPVDICTSCNLLLIEQQNVSLIVLLAAARLQPFSESDRNLISSWKVLSLTQTVHFDRLATRRMHNAKHFFPNRVRNYFAVEIKANC